MVIGVVSQKGGVGKTTLTQNLGAELSATGMRILLVDFDPKGNLGVGWGLDPDGAKFTIWTGLADPNKTSEAIKHVRPKLDIILANETLAVSEQGVLRNALAEVKQNYDVVLIDGPPSLGWLTKNVIDAADHLLIPLQAHPFAYRAVEQLVRTMCKNKSGRGDSKPYHIVMSMIDQRNALTRAIDHSARARYGQHVFKTQIPLNVAVAEALLDGVPVGEYERTSKGAKAFRALAKEIKKM